MALSFSNIVVDLIVTDCYHGYIKLINNKMDCRNLQDYLMIYCNNFFVCIIPAKNRNGFQFKTHYFFHLSYNIFLVRMRSNRKCSGFIQIRL